MLFHYLRKIAIWFGVLCLVWFIFTKPAQFGDLIGKGFDGLTKAVTAVVTVLDKVSQ